MAKSIIVLANAFEGDVEVINWKKTRPLMLRLGVI